MNYLPTNAQRPENFTNLQKFPPAWPSPPIPHMTLETLLERHKAHHLATVPAVETSPSYIQFLSSFMGIIQQPSLRISNSIFLGLGSLSGQQSSLDCESSMSRLVLFETLIELLRQKHYLPPWRIYFQDPSFNDLDRKLLLSRGYRVLDSPASNDVLTEETFLFAPFNCWDVIFASLRRCFPAMLMGMPLEKATHYFYWRPILEKLQKDYCQQRRMIQIPSTAFRDGNDVQVLYYKGDGKDHGGGCDAETGAKVLEVGTLTEAFCSRLWGSLQKIRTVDGVL